MTTYPYVALPDYPLPQNTTQKKTKTHLNTDILPHTPTYTLVQHPHTRLFMPGLRLRPNFSTQFERGSLWGNLGPRTSQFLHSGFFFLDFLFLGIGPCGLVPPPPLECNSILPLVTTVLITPKGDEAPVSRRIGVIGALVLILPSETV